MKIKKIEIDYIEYLGRLLVSVLNDFNKECGDNENYIYASQNRARFNRIRLELNKTLLKVKKELYNENN